MWNEHCRGSVAIEFETPVDEIGSTHEKHLKLSNQRRLLDYVNNSCSEILNADSLYKECRLNGNVYGSTFAKTKELRVGDCQAINTVVIPDITAYMPSHFLQPHVIHPETLDNIFQINIPLYLRHCSQELVMPVSIAEIVISAKVVSDPGEEFQVVTTFSPAGQRSATVDTLAFQRKGSEMIPVITISQAELRGLSDVQTTALSSKVTRNITYRMEWGADISFYNSEKLNPAQDVYNSEGGKMSPEQKKTLLIRTASLYINAFLKQLNE